MTCKYSEHVIACGIGGYAVGTRPVPHIHQWDDYWHMGYIIGRQCRDDGCKMMQYMSKRWCDKRQKIAESK